MHDLLDYNDNKTNELVKNILENSNNSFKSCKSHLSNKSNSKGDYDYSVSDLHPSNNFKSLKVQSSLGSLNKDSAPKSIRSLKVVTERVGHAIRHKSRSVIDLNKVEPSTVRMVKNNSEEYKK